MARIETTILRNLIEDEDYARKVVPYLKSEYFFVDGERAIFDEVINFYRLYNKKPSIAAILIELGQSKKLSESSAKTAEKLLDEFKTLDAVPDETWLLSKTETFCKDKSIFIAMLKSIDIAEGKTKFDKGIIPELLKEALAITFDPRVGHDYIDDSDSRYTYYTNVEEKLKFDLDILNKATNGGIPMKTLNILLGGIHAGKTAFMCSFAASYLLMGKNVLYITMEMAEEEIAKRVDANLLNIPMSELHTTPKSFFDTKVANLKAKTMGKFIIKEYPTAGANVNNFRALLNDLNLKRGFKPDVVLVDYLNICSSTRFKAGDHNSYTFVQAIAQELRGLAQELGVPIWSATQMNRTGMTSSDPEMTDTSESMGLPAIADLMWAIVRNEELDRQGHLMLKQLKNRYEDKSNMIRFLLGLDRIKMRLHEVEDSTQKKLAQDPNVTVPVSRSKPGISTDDSVKKPISKGWILD